MPNQPINTSTMKKKKELSATLNKFYHNPIAKVSMELFLTVGLVIFLGVFAIQPTIVTMSDLLREIENKKDLDQRLTQKIASLQTAQTEYARLEPSFVILDEVIPEQPDVIRSVKIIEKIAADSRVVIRSLSINQIPSKDDENILFAQKTKQNITVSVSVLGDYPSIREFSESLRNSRTSFVTESVVFTLGEERGEKRLGATISVSIPYFGTE
jgi:Tfp pilus assembly protein PilO